MFGKKKLIKTGKMRSAKQLGQILGLSAQDVNVILKNKGYLEGKPGEYKLTKKAEPYAEIRYKDNGYGGSAARGWEFIMWDSCIMYEVSDDKYPGIDWYCDGCHAYLNIQNKFDDHKKHWKCTECGYKNEISMRNIRED